MSRMSPTYAEIAASYALWMEYYDIDGHDTLAQWEQMGQDARVEMLRDAFGDKPDDAPDDDHLAEAEAEIARWQRIRQLLADRGITRAEGGR